MQQSNKHMSPDGTGLEQLLHAADALQRIDEEAARGRPLALFLDIDGTLLDVALTPSTVHVPPDLPELLDSISYRLGGALAIVTGRSIAEADNLLRPLRPVAAGVHGAEMRVSAGGDIRSLSSSLRPALKAKLRTLAEGMPGIVVEDKGAGAALHYRLAPELGEALLLSLQALAREHPEEFTICEGRKVIEVLPVGFSKGRALQDLSALPPFAGRIPVMIGDDIADVGAFRAAESLGGYGLRVAGENFNEAEASFAGPAEVLAWLKHFARGS